MWKKLGTLECNLQTMLTLKLPLLVIRFIHWRKNLAHRLYRGKQHPAAQHSPTQTHDGASPKASNPVILHNTFNSLHSSRRNSRLTPSFNRIERLCCQRRDRAGQRSIHKVNDGALLDAPSTLEFLDDVVAPHAKARCRSLLERRAREATIQAEEAVLSHNSSNRMESRREAFGTLRVIDERRLDALRRRDGENTGQYACAHTS